MDSASSGAKTHDDFISFVAELALVCVCLCTVLTRTASDVIAAAGLQQLGALADVAVVLRMQTEALPPLGASDGLTADLGALPEWVLAVTPSRPLCPHTVH